jgi:hypothetical protein
MTDDRVGSAALTMRWHVRNQSLFFYEIDADVLAPLLAPQLELAEVRPGIALMSLECLHYRAGHYRPDHPESYEMVIAAIVHPNLSIDMPVPKFALQIINVITDSADFAVHEAEILGSPMVHVPGLAMTFTADGTSVDVRDGNQPIVSCRNTDPDARYERKELWGLTYATRHGLQHGIFRWQGEVHEHMKRGAYGALHPHAAFLGIDTSRVRGCYRQMSARPDGPTEIRYYHLGPA